MSEMSETAAAPKAGAVRFGGRLTVCHPNGRGTGSAATFALCPATQDGEGGVAVRILPQKDLPCIEFDEGRAIEFRLSPVEVAEVLRVFNGYEESVRDDNGFFHRIDRGATIMTLSHVIEPSPGYRLSLSRRAGFGDDAKRERLQILLTVAEMYALAGAIDGAMPYIVFGVRPLIFRTVEDAAADVGGGLLRRGGVHHEDSPLRGKG